MLRIEDAETAGSDWKEILYNERINRTNANTNNAYFILTKNAGRMLSAYLSDILATMVGKNVAAYEPAKQTRAVLVYWRLPDEWAEVLYDWVCKSNSVLL